MNLTLFKFLHTPTLLSHSYIPLHHLPNPSAPTHPQQGYPTVAEPRVSMLRLVCDARAEGEAGSGGDGAVWE